MSRQSAAAYLNVYSVREFESATGQKANSWTKVGVAFPHKEPPGFNLELNALPLSGHLVVLPPSEDDAAHGPGG
ncbi:MAG TPA: hypothetical protein VMG11_06705 [Steroidobacteraceae bacterium]|nr:hypothetical protein [Steroidobacteraceae bacterium]